MVARPSEYQTNDFTPFQFRIDLPWLSGEVELVTQSLYRKRDGSCNQPASIARDMSNEAYES